MCPVCVTVERNSQIFPELRTIGPDVGAELIERLNRRAAGIRCRLYHDRRNRTDQDRLGHTFRSVATDVARLFSTTSGMTDVDRVFLLIMNFISVSWSTTYLPPTQNVLETFVESEGSDGWTPRSGARRQRSPTVDFVSVRLRPDPRRRRGSRCGQRSRLGRFLRPCGPEACLSNAVRRSSTRIVQI